MEIDRAVYKDFNELGLGYANPFPRATIEPFGHWFLPALYGCICVYFADGDPCVPSNTLTPEQIDQLKPWTCERIENCKETKEVLAQVTRLREIHRDYKSKNPTASLPAISSMQNTGSVVNTGFSVQGEQLFIDYMLNPESVKKLYQNIAELTMACLDLSPAIDGTKLEDVYIGNCCVSMISPSSYVDLRAWI